MKFVSETLNARIICFSTILPDLTSYLFPSCGRLETTVPAFEPDVGRDLYIRSPDIHSQQTEPCPIPKASRRKVKTYRRRIAHGRDRCTTQCLRVNILGDNTSRCWDRHVSLGCTLAYTTRDGYYLRPCTSQKSQLLCQSLPVRHT